MAQRIITLCDVHARSDEDKAGATWEVTLTGPGLKATTWEGDLCADGEQKGAVLEPCDVPRFGACAFWKHHDRDAAFEGPLAR